MKKLFLTATFLLGMTMGAFAEWYPYSSGWLFFDLFNLEPEQEDAREDGLFENPEANAVLWENFAMENPSFNINPGGGLFGRGKSLYTGVGSNFRNDFGLFLPGSHGGTDDTNGAPLGSGIVVLLGLGGAYFVAKKRKEI